MKLATLIFCVLALLGVGVLTLKNWGEHQSYVPFDHPLLNQKSAQSLVVVETLEEAARIAGAEVPVTFVLPVKVSQDGQVFIIKEETWQKIQQTEKYHLISSKSEKPKTRFQYFESQDLLDMGPGIHTLEAFLHTYPQRTFVLWITDNVDDIHLKVLDVVQKVFAKGALAIASPIDPVLKSIKEIRPLTAFSLSQGEQVRLLSFDSIGLAPAIQINGDFIFSNLRWKSRTLVSAGIVQEMHRRFKKVFLGPLEDKDQVKQAQDLGADGYVFPSVEVYQNIISAVRF